jgi:hypothetical protein
MDDREIERRYAGSRALAGLLLVGVTGVAGYLGALAALLGAPRYLQFVDLPVPDDLARFVVVAWAALGVRLGIPGGGWNPVLAMLATLVLMGAVAHAYYGAWARERRDAFRAAARAPPKYDREAGRRLAGPRSYARGSAGRGSRR